MSIATVVCRAQLGLHAPLVQVEVSLDSGLPNFSIVGLAATVVKESKDRVRAAIVNSNFEFPAGRITINLSPADIPKRGGRFDLPIALGILLASGQVKMDPESRIDPGHREFYGELGLNGELRSVPGMLLAAAHAARMGHEVIVPDANADEVRLLLGHRARRSEAGRPSHARRTSRIGRHCGLPVTCSPCAHISMAASPIPASHAACSGKRQPRRRARARLADVRGQVQAKRALTIAAAGGHSILMRGPPGAGKSMLAMRLPGLLPPMTEAESLEVAAIASASGIGFNVSSFGHRPMRTPHHTASAVSLVGGGSYRGLAKSASPTTACCFSMSCWNTTGARWRRLREPLESGVVSISRAIASHPISGAIPTHCSHEPLSVREIWRSARQLRLLARPDRTVLGRVSGPMLERFDIHLEVPRVNLSDFEDAEAAERVQRDRRRPRQTRAGDTDCASG